MKLVSYRLACMLTEYLLRILSKYPSKNWVAACSRFWPNKFGFCWNKHSLGICSTHDTPPRMARIKGLKSWILKRLFLAYEWCWKVVLNFFILKSYVLLQRYLLNCQANSAVLGRFFALGSSNSEGANMISK